MCVLLLLLILFTINFAEQEYMPNSAGASCLNLCQ